MHNDPNSLIFVGDDILMHHNKEMKLWQELYYMR